MGKIIDKQKQEYQLRLKAELRHIDKLLADYYTKYKLTYRTNIDSVVNEFKTQFLEKYLNDFPSIVSSEKRFELSNVNFQFLESNQEKRANLINEIEQNNPVINLSAAQQDDIAKIEKILKAINEVTSELSIDEKVKFIREIGRNISLENGKLTTNIHFILNKQHFARC